jgi:hypothetical protein
MKWPRHPNLRRRPRAPSKGRGRIQRQVARTFLIYGPVVSSSQVYDLVFTRRRHCGSHFKRRRVWQVLRSIADPVRKVPPHGTWLWRLRNSEQE